MQRDKDQANQRSMTTAAMADKELAHTNAEKARTAWPISNTWRLETALSSIEENKGFSLFSHKVMADSADELSAGLVFNILLVFWHFRQILLHPTGCKNGCHFPVRQNTNNTSLSSYKVGKDSRRLLRIRATSTISYKVPIRGIPRDG